MLCRGYIKIAVVVICLAGISGCQSKGPDTGKKEQKGQVLAEVNGSVITTEDFKKEIQVLPPYLQQMAETAEGRKEMLDSMVVRELVMQDAQKQGIDKSPEIAAKVEDMKRRVIVEAYLKKKIEDQIKVSDEDLQKMYDQNKDKFKTGEQVKASHILVKTEKEAQDVLAQIKAGGKFEELAAKFSIDPAGKKGGDLGWFGKGSMIPEFEKVVFSMKGGDISGAVKTKFGYHIIKLTGKRPAGILPFAEVKEQLKQSLVPEKQQEVFKKIKEDLKKGAKLTIKEDALNSLGGNPADKKPAPAEAKEKK
jgi:peptidyl-prolyl cis-trans isomerase C